MNYFINFLKWSGIDCWILKKEIKISVVSAFVFILLENRFGNCSYGKFVFVQ